MEVKLSLINEILGDLEGIRNRKKGYDLIRQESKELDYLYQGDYNEYHEIYSTPIENIYLELIIRTDSYNENEFIHSIQFVTPIEKTIQVFKPLS